MSASQPCFRDRGATSCSATSRSRSSPSGPRTGGGGRSPPRPVTKGTQWRSIFGVKPFRWSAENNASLVEERGISFESMVVAIESGGLLDILAHPNPAKYPRQRVLVVAADDYVYLVPFVEEEDYFFLKTIVPSRRATKDYLSSRYDDAED